MTRSPKAMLRTCSEPSLPTCSGRKPKDSPTRDYKGPDEVLSGVLARLGSEWEGFQAVPPS